MIRIREATSYRRVLISLAIALCAISFFFHYQEEYSWYRAMRGMASFSALGILIFFQRKELNLLLALFLFFYGISSLCTIWYENTLLATTSLVINFVAFLLLIRTIFPKVSFKKMSWWLLTIFVLLVLFNGYLLYEFVAMIESYAGSVLHYTFMLLGAMCLLIAGFLALLYNHRFSSRTSLILVLFVFSFVFAEVFRAIAYYDFAFGDASVYIARVLLIMGSFLLVHFALMPKNKEEALNSRIF